MDFCARNQLNGKITSVELGAVMANIKIEIIEIDYVILVSKTDTALDWKNVGVDEEL